MIVNLLLLVVLVAILVAGLAWYMSTKVILLPRELLRKDWMKYRLHPEWVWFTAEDGIGLNGAFIPGTNGATIILLHGYGRCKEQMLPQASFLNEAGYNILMFDFRGSGESGGKYITFGQREQLDLVAAVQYLNQRPGIDTERIGLLGFSMGGATALMKSNDLPQIKAIVISSSYARFKSVIWQNFQRYLKGIPFFPIGYITLWIIKLRTGIYFPSIAPIRHLAALKNRPMMIIHGSHDKRIPVENALEFHRQAPWLHEFWLVKDADHDDLFSLSHDRYREKVLSFFTTYLTAPFIADRDNC